MLAGALFENFTPWAFRGGFVPGLTNLDSQVQILAYAFLFGYAQQLFTKIIDKQGQTILGSVPSKDSGSARPEIVTAQ